MLLKRTCADLLRASPAQGPQPHEGDPAAPGAPRRPAAPHLQLAEGPPDREGSAAGAGGGRRLDRRLPGGGGEEEERQRGARPLPHSCGRWRALRHVCGKHIRGSKKKTKHKTNQKTKVIPFHLSTLGVDGGAFRSTQYITVLSHISILYLSHRGTAVLFYLYPGYPLYTC